MKKSMILTLLVVLFATLTLFAQKAGSIQDQQACEYARRNNSAEIWQNYLKRFPQGMCAFEAESEIQKLKNRNQNKNEPLQWSSRSSNQIYWSGIKEYCENLTEGGYSDWRLPNIDELRTTIKNCFKTEHGGLCKISEKNGCLSGKRCGNGYISESCYCDYKKNAGGYYSKLGDDDQVVLWSSSVRSDDSSCIWVVSFIDGAVTCLSPVISSGYVRCVR